MLSIYSGARKPKPIGAIRIGAAVELIRDDDRLKVLTGRARAVLAEKGKDAYRAFKAANLRGITWAGEFAHRKADGLTMPSGLVFVESDGIPDAAAERERIGANPAVAVAYISVGGDGVHAAVRVKPTPRGADDYRDAWATAMDVLDLTDGGGDASVKDISRLAFMPHDPDIYANPKARALAWAPGYYAESEGREQAAAHERKPYKPARAGGANWIDHALAVLNPDAGGYQAWVDVGMALHAGELDGAITDGLARFDRWSASGAKYKAGEPAKKWASFKRTGITLGTLWHLARGAGWNPNADKDLCRDCGVNYHKPEYRQCWDCKQAGGAAVPGGELRLCADCGRRLYATSGHAWDACGQADDGAEGASVTDAFIRDWEGRREADGGAAGGAICVHDVRMDACGYCAAEREEGLDPLPITTPLDADGLPIDGAAVERVDIMSRTGGGVYSVSAASCNCAAGSFGQDCWHRAAAALMLADNAIYCAGADCAAVLPADGEGGSYCDTHAIDAWTPWRTVDEWRGLGVERMRLSLAYARRNAEKNADGAYRLTLDQERREMELARAGEYLPAGVGGAGVDGAGGSRWVCFAHAQSGGGAWACTVCAACEPCPICSAAGAVKDAFGQCADAEACEARRLAAESADEGGAMRVVFQIDPNGAGYLPARVERTEAN